MKLFSKIALATATVSIASFASAAPTQISGSTDFRVTLPEILVLYHWDDAHLILQELTTTSAANDSDAREISDAKAHSLTANIAAGTYDITQNPVDTATGAERTTGNKVAVTLKDAWAVRSLSNAPVKLALTNPNAILKNVTDNKSTILTEGAVLASTGTGVANSGTANITIPSGWTPVKGDIKFSLNLANANNSGEYNTRGTAGAASDQQNSTDTFLLTLTGNQEVPVAVTPGS